MTQDSFGQTRAMPHQTPEILDVLKQCAVNETTITYTDLVEGTSISRRDVGEQLTYIHEQVCLPHNRPWLCVLAVSKETGLPSPGVSRATGVSFTGTVGKRLWEKERLAVYAYDWANVDL